MNNKPRLILELNRLKRDERALKTEELTIRRTKTAKDHRDPLLLNHQQRMKNKRQQARITAEIRSLSAQDALAAAEVVAPVISAPLLLLPQNATPAV